MLSIETPDRNGLTVQFWAMTSLSANNRNDSQIRECHHNFLQGKWGVLHLFSQSCYIQHSYYISIWFYVSSSFLSVTYQLLVETSQGYETCRTINSTPLDNSVIELGKKGSGGP